MLLALRMEAKAEAKAKAKAGRHCRSQTNLTSRLPVTRGHAGTRIRKHVHVSASQQTAFRLTCGSSQSAECNLAGLLFALSTSEGGGLI
ncbi:hypothetical protein EYF80_045247 [Liparis tanakae]|uniref:Uncharacterized protein n=1 Tax=Liparis tanakae TaxID=230148 RepID=A0A4Z2FUU2_9TELE|nr:hypothetical protein EYF80_045247 [Liparis tanakae]